MKTVSRWLLATSGFAGIVLFFACNKNSSSNSNPNIPKGQSQVSMYMMDGPVSASKVSIDIVQVRVEVDTATSQNASDQPNQWDNDYCGFGRNAGNKSVIWDTLDITPGVYDLLALRNGTDTLLASGLYTTGKILKIQITLGSQDTVYTDSTTWYPLVIFGPSPTFTINVSRTNVEDVTNNEFKLWLDFNLQRSLFFWNGEFFLSPYITVFNDVMTAKVEGVVLPPGAGAAVIGINGTDTIYAVPFYNGQYEFRNVPAGTWSFDFKGSNGFQDTTITNVQVDSMKTVQLPTITLHH
jgi:hypothetical protein